MRIANLTLVMLGAVTLAFSIGLESSILAFVGFGCSSGALRLHMFERMSM